MKNTNNFMHILAIVIVASTIGLMVLLFFFEIPESNKTLLVAAVGSMLTLTGVIGTYYFGSSQSSNEKNKMIERNGNTEIKP